MKRNFLHLAVLMVAMGAALASCNKTPQNPKPVDLPGKAFTISIIENRDKATFEWTVEGGKTVNPAETIQELCVTAFNTVTLKTGGVDVNVSSSNPAVVAIEKVGTSSSSYSLVYKGGSGDNAKVGLATIKVWNGSGAAEVSQSFTVKGLEFVDVEGLRFTYGGEPLVVKHVAYSRPKVYCRQGDVDPDFSQRSKDCDFTWFQFKKPNIQVPREGKPGYYDFITDTTQGALLRFEGLEPENTSFRTVVDFESEWDYCWNMTSWLQKGGYFEEGLYADWPNETNVNKDVSDYVGREIWIAELGQTYVVCMKVKLDGNKSKYLILYYGKEN
ncbi:MAG: hypothetical protein IJ753_04375 [Bacteroidales bacterium]|nr:hypothetical protein [Bacteroidales bacterium]